MTQPVGRNARIALALGALYLIWGTTYFGIKEAVAHIPSLSMAAIRFLVPGIAILAIVALRGTARPSARMWLRATVLGTLMLTIGNGVVTLVETRMPSGVTALIVATVPMWTAVFEWGIERRRPHVVVALSLVLGLCGVALLAKENAGWVGPVEPSWVFALVLSSGCWALGSILSRKPWPKPISFWQDLGMQMVCGGAVLAAGALLRGEPAMWNPSMVPAQTWLWVAYLSLFGSVVALGCYLWLLRTTSPALATTYGFVNPAVAVGVAAIAGEQVTPLTLAASALIITAVAIIVWAKTRKNEPPASGAGTANDPSARRAGPR